MVQRHLWGDNKQKCSSERYLFRLLRQRGQRLAEEGFKVRGATAILVPLRRLRDGAFDGDLLIPEVHQRGEHILLNWTAHSSRSGSRSAELLQLIAKLKHHPLGGLFANAGHACESREIVAPDCCHGGTE